MKFAWLYPKLLIKGSEWLIFQISDTKTASVIFISKEIKMTMLSSKIISNPWIKDNFEALACSLNFWFWIFLLFWRVFMPLMIVNSNRVNKIGKSHRSYLNHDSKPRCILFPWNNILSWVLKTITPTRVDRSHLLVFARVLVNLIGLSNLSSCSRPCK